MKTVRWQMVMEDGPGPLGFKRSEDVAQHLIDQGHADRDREAFLVLLLNVKHQLIAEELVSVGILDGSLIHPREVFKAAVSAGAAGVIVAHNHPSGDPTPSAADREVTQRLWKAGEILGIPIIDHVIIGAGTHRAYSFKAEGGWS